MSKEKMERYKAAKTNKEEIRKKQKKEKILTRTIWIAVLVVVIGLIGVGIYFSLPSQNNTVTTDATQTISLEDLLADYNLETVAETFETDIVVEAETTANQ